MATRGEVRGLVERVSPSVLNGGLLALCTGRDSIQLGHN